MSKYKEDINPNVQLIVVRVGKGWKPFRDDLAAHGIDYRSVEIDDKRPDLAKMDGLLGQLRMLSSSGHMGNDSTSQGGADEGNDFDSDFVVV